MKSLKEIKIKLKECETKRQSYNLEQVRSRYYNSGFEDALYWVIREKELEK